MTKSVNNNFSKFAKRFAIVVSKFDMFSGMKNCIIGIAKSEKSAKALAEEIKKTEPSFSTIEIVPIFWEE